MIFEIDGVDFSSYVEEGGLNWTRGDIDSKNSGRNTLDAVAVRDRIRVLYNLSVTCMPMTEEACMKLLEALEPQFVMVTVKHPRYGVCTREMYANNFPIHHIRTEADGTELWDGIKFPLVER